MSVSNRDHYYITKPIMPARMLHQALDYPQPNAGIVSAIVSLLVSSWIRSSVHHKPQSGDRLIVNLQPTKALGLATRVWLFARTDEIE
jgi:hypothetical protein